MTHPTQDLWKDLIRSGSYRHPTRRFTVHVDRHRIDRWAKTFSRMKANGVRVHIPADHSDAAKDNRGFVLQMKRIGNRLMALCRFIGADAIRDASRNQVSIGVAPVFADGKGNLYRDAIIHVALTPVPVVPGQGPFIPAGTVSATEGVPSALSGAAPAGVLHLAAAHFRSSPMAQTLLPCSDQTLASLHDLVPGLSDIPGEDKLGKVLQFIQSLVSDETPPAELSAAADDLPAPANAALLEAVKAKRDLCISRGALTPAVADALMNQFTATESGGAGASQILTLSRQSDRNLLALSIFSALADNRPIATGERTAPQTRPLNRAIPGESAPSGPPLHERMAALADGKCVEL